MYELVAAIIAIGTFCPAQHHQHRGSRVELGRKWWSFALMLGIRESGGFGDRAVETEVAGTLLPQVKGDQSSEGIDFLAALLVLAGKGDRRAFDQLYELTNAKLFGICLRVYRDRPGAEDVLVEVYLSVWRSASTWRIGRASPITWLAVIARNRSIDWTRRQGPIEPLSDYLIDHYADPAPHHLTVLLAAESSSRTMRALDRLESRKREAITSAFMEGLTYAQLAARSNVPLGTMKGWIRRGLLDLRDMLEEDNRN